MKDNYVISHSPFCVTFLCWKCLHCWVSLVHSMVVLTQPLVAGGVGRVLHKNNAKTTKKPCKYKDDLP